MFSNSNRDIIDFINLERKSFLFRKRTFNLIVKYDIAGLACIIGFLIIVVWCMFASPNIANASVINDGIEHNWELVEENAYIDTGTMSYNIENEELTVWSKKIIESSEAEELRKQAKYAGISHGDRSKISKIHTITELRNCTTINMVITYTVKRRIIYDINNNILYDFTNDNDKVYVGMGADGVAYMKCMNILEEAGKE